MKRSDELIPLSHDHHTALVLARRCVQSVGPSASVAPAEAWRQVREAFGSHLEPHFHIEETSLLPPLEALGESELVERVRLDHRQLREMAACPAAGNAEVERFGRLLEAHVRFEERQLFEVAQARLPQAVLAEVAQACLRHPRAAPGCAVGDPA